MKSFYGGNRDLEDNDLQERKKLLSKYKYSVIVECGHMELDNLMRWIEENLQTEPVKNIYYGKIAYDYGFVEFFFLEKIKEEKLRQVVPNIYTTYPFSHPSGKILKSDGYDKDIEYNPIDQNAIVYPANTKS
jgi:hypothetical protein